MSYELTEDVKLTGSPPEKLRKLATLMDGNIKRRIVWFHPEVKAVTALLREIANESDGEKLRGKNYE